MSTRLSKHLSERGFKNRTLETALHDFCVALQQRELGVPNKLETSYTVNIWKQWQLCHIGHIHGLNNRDPSYLKDLIVPYAPTQHFTIRLLASLLIGNK